MGPWIIRGSPAARPSRRCPILGGSPITEAKVGQTMTLLEIAAAAVTRSDNAAGNLLLRELGGPQRFTAFLRSLGDQAARLDDNEPALGAFRPGDDRNTTTPAGLAADYRAVTLGAVLGTPERVQLIQWMREAKTGDSRIRAGLPSDWITADKTGTGGNYGCVNDAAITWPANGHAPLVIAIQACGNGENGAADETLFPEVTRLVLDGLR
nr:class A beta-lactamase [Nocardia panacis]